MAVERVALLLFWLAIAWVAYSAVGYLVLLGVVARFVRRPVMRADITPRVTMLIAARDEEDVIGAKLENTLALDYPRDLLQVIVMSDGSIDGTDEIVRSFAGRGVGLNRVVEGRGKPNAMNRTLPLSKGEILLVSDADSMYAPDALRKLVRNFADCEVGAVTGEERRLATSGGVGLGESLYCRLDNRIKRLEGQVGSMHMVNGGFAAIRRSLCPPLDPNVNFDLVWAPLLRLQGYRTVYEPEAISIESYALDAESDFRRRTRTVMQACYSYLSVREAMNPARTGWFALELLSHRFARWLVMPWLVTALVSNLWLAQERRTYALVMSLQLACYLLAAAGWLLERKGWRAWTCYMPYYFLYIHTAAFLGLVQALSGKRIADWTPTARALDHVARSGPGNAA